MDIYVAHTEKMADSAIVLAKHLGASHGSISKAPEDSFVIFLGVPSEVAAGKKYKAKILGSLKDIRALLRDKKKVLNLLNENNEEFSDGEDFLIYVIDNQIIAILGQVVKSRRESLYEKLGKELADELIENGDIYEPNQSIEKEDKVDIYSSIVQNIQSAIDGISEAYDVGVYVLKCKVKQIGKFDNKIYYTNIMLSPSLRRRGIAEKIADKVKYFCESVELAKNKSFLSLLSDEKTMDKIIENASANEIAAISKVFDIVNREAATNE